MTVQAVETSELLGRGLYSPTQVGQLVGISPSRVRRWMQGYRYVYPTSQGLRKGSSPPVIMGDLPVIAEMRAVSFVELVEILVVSALLDRGVSVRTVRRAADRAAKKLGNDHPFAFEKFKTDGKGVFLELRQESDEYKPLLEMARGQYAFSPVLSRYLDEIDFDVETLMALRWWPLGKGKPVVVDPDVAFGAPVIRGTRVTVNAIVNALGAGERRKSVCDWFGLSPRDVNAAVEFARKRHAA